VCECVWYTNGRVAPSNGWQRSHHVRFPLGRSRACTFFETLLFIFIGLDSFFYFDRAVHTMNVNSFVRSSLYIVITDARPSTPVGSVTRHVVRRLSTVATRARRIYRYDIVPAFGEASPHISFTYSTNFPGAFVTCNLFCLFLYIEYINILAKQMSIER